jgi:hypothetical protein
MAHCFADTRAKDFFGEPVHAYAQIAVPGYTVYHFGHDHSDHGVVRVDERSYIQVGALTRGALSGEEIHRRPQLVVVSHVEGRVKVQPIALRVKPAAEVFNFEAKARRDTEASVVAAFVAHLEASSHAVVDIPDHLRRLELPPEVLSRVEAYLARAEAEAG